MPYNPYRAIIFGSNFGFNVHYNCLKKIFKFNEIAICSPNINKKKIAVTKKYSDFNLALINNYKFISISTPPKIQNKICDFILKKKKKPEFLILEKPLTQNFKETSKLLQRLNKKQIKFIVNFIYVNIEEFIEFKKIINKNEIKNFTYEWNFKQGYFLNKKKTWKISDKDGGGLVNYYLIHIFYNLLFFFKNIKLLKVVLIRKNKIITQCKIKLSTDRTFKIKILMNINANKSLHSVRFTTKKSKFELLNQSKDWVNGFKIKKNNKSLIRNFKKVDRYMLTHKNYINLSSTKNRKSNNEFSKKAHKLCKEVLNF